MMCSTERKLMGLLRSLNGPWSFWSSSKFIMLTLSQQGCHISLDKGPAGLDVLATECVDIHKGDGELWSNLGNIVDDTRRLMVQLRIVDVCFQPRLGN
ncbi:hypothetical protein L3X38_017573 [Prunus dulcis]|uniref:Uncharacterized protein n=1 Tax=Prunus dulcis TaxID=3755 RepID=A0AAD4Z9A1_PRUDU|nr:hypothetical protein L3X38_017573 [Prunus dulcis]